MTANVSGINPNHTFLLTSMLLERSGDHRTALLYRILTDDVRFNHDYQTNQQLADRLGVTRSLLVVSMDKLVDWGVIWPPEKSGSVRTITVCAVPSPRFIVWSLQTLIPGFDQARAEALAEKAQPLVNFTYPSYGFSHSDTPVPPRLFSEWNTFVLSAAPHSIDQGYVVAGPQDTSEAVSTVEQYMHACSCSCSCSILTTSTNTTDRDATTPLNGQIALTGLEGSTPREAPKFVRTPRTVSRRKNATKLGPLKNSWASRYRTLADLMAIEPEQYTVIVRIIQAYNQIFGKALAITPHTYATTREVLVEAGLSEAVVMQNLTAAARDPFWLRQSYISIMKPGRIDSFNTTKHDRYARNQVQQPDANTETREF